MEIMPKSNSLLFVTTGGTFDKSYFDALSDYKICDTVVKTLLERGRMAMSYRVLELIQKDSLELDDGDRATIYNTVRDAPERRIIIIHGTDTMAKTAGILESISRKVIVLTGAFAPARFSESDAFFNLGMAIATAQCKSRGVFITMNGTVFRGSAVIKDRFAETFVRTNR